MNKADSCRWCFFLGGHDLEMVTIAELLRRHVPGDQIIDHQLSWGASASAYGESIIEAVHRGLIPVLIELNIDLELPSEAIVVDHHNEQAGQTRPTALEQVFELLERPVTEWSRWYSLVAANDRGHIRELLAVGAHEDEVRAIRAADREAQGVTADDESMAQEAVQGASLWAGGALTVATLRNHRSSVVADLFEPALGGPGFRNLLVRCPDSVAFYGEGRLINLLCVRFPGGWYGGALPERGYWGLESSSGHDEVAAALTEFLVGALDPEDDEPATCRTSAPPS